MPNELNNSSKQKLNSLQHSWQRFMHETKMRFLKQMQHKQVYLIEITKMIHVRQHLYRIVTFAFPDNDGIEWPLVRVDLVYSFFIIASASQAQEKAQPVTGWLSGSRKARNQLHYYNIILKLTLDISNVLTSESIILQETNQRGPIK